MEKKIFVKVPLSVVQDRDLCPGDIEVYAVLRSFADGKTGKNCYPTHRRLAAVRGISVSKVKKRLDRLKERGHIYWKSGRTGRANSYAFDGSHLLGNPQVHGEPPDSHDSTPHQESVTKNEDQGGVATERATPDGYKSDMILDAVPEQFRKNLERRVRRSDMNDDTSCADK